MPIRQVLKVSRKTFFNPAGWLNYQVLKDQNRVVWEIFRDGFASPVATQSETFEEAQARLELSDADIEQGARRFRLYAISFCILGLALVFYAFYLIIRHGTVAGWLLSIVAAALFFGQAFKFDFWSFQMRRRRLGATFADWKRSLFSQKDSV